MWQDDRGHALTSPAAATVPSLRAARACEARPDDGRELSFERYSEHLA